VRTDSAAVFGPGSAAYALFQALDARMAEAFPRAAATVHRTQVSYDNGRVFAAAWVPYGKRGGRENIVSFSLRRKIEHPRIHDAIFHSTNRCAHHVVITRTDEIDDALMNWLAEADSIPRGK
jgi:hypothetical protein